MRFYSLWLKAGDKNTTFFHNQTNTKKKRNNVNEIYKANGDKHIEFEDIKKEAFEHFKELYMEEDTEPVSVDNMLQGIPGLVTSENRHLTTEIREEEVINAI